MVWGAAAPAADAWPCRTPRAAGAQRFGGRPHSRTQAVHMRSPGGAPLRCTARARAAAPRLPPRSPPSTRPAQAGWLPPTRLQPAAPRGPCSHASSAKPLSLCLCLCLSPGRAAAQQGARLHCREWAQGGPGEERGHRHGGGGGVAPGSGQPAGEQGRWGGGQHYMSGVLEGTLWGRQGRFSPWGQHVCVSRTKRGRGWMGGAWGGPSASPIAAALQAWDL